MMVGRTRSQRTETAHNRPEAKPRIPGEGVARAHGPRRYNGSTGYRRKVSNRPGKIDAQVIYSNWLRGRLNIQTTTKLMVTFQPDERDADSGVAIETGLFLGVREEPALESTQLRWQVRLHPSDIFQVESSGTYLEELGGALFITTKEPLAEMQPGETRGPVGWMKWIGNNSRRSFQIQLAISAAGFDRVCRLAEKGQYPDAILTFKEDGPIEHGFSPEGNKKVWTKDSPVVALLAEFTLRYDFSRGRPTRGHSDQNID